MASNYQGVLNVGTGRNCSFNEVIGTINDRLKIDIIKVKKPNKNYLMDILADTTKWWKI
jgi:hypothetical protein